MDEEARYQAGWAAITGGFIMLVLASLSSGLFVASTEIVLTNKFWIALGFLWLSPVPVFLYGLLMIRINRSDVSKIIFKVN